jgi:hypothetical protein
MRVAFEWVNGFEPIAVTVWRGGHEDGARGEHETLDHLSFVLYRSTIYMIWPRARMPAFRRVRLSIAYAA